MSLNKIKSLRLRTSSQGCEPASKVEADTSMILVEEMKTHAERIELPTKNHESMPPLHSTPKRSSGKSNSTQDQSGIEYRVSPILLPCTQDGGNEVAWDWQSPLTKSNLKRNRNNGEPTGTPKRTTLLQKKRNSNSPLLYKPIKRKLMRNSDHQQESIDKFTAEMKALSEQIKTVPRDEVSNGNTNESEDELLIQIDIADFVECENKFEVTTSDDDSSRKNCQVVVKTSMDDLFDDSVDDSMVKCSQEVEEKLRLESCRETSSKRNSASSTGVESSSYSWHQQSYSRFRTARNKPANETKNTSKLGDSKNVSNLAKVVKPTYEAKKSTIGATSSNFSGTNPAEEANKTPRSSDLPKSSCINNNVSKVGKSALSSTVSTQKDVFEIPDDSFDDFIAVCFDDVENPVGKSKQEANQPSTHYGKVYVSPHSAGLNNNSRRFEKPTARKILLPPPSQSFCSVVKASSTVERSGNASKVFPRSGSNDSLKPRSSVGTQSQLQTQTTMTTMTTTNNQGRKFFKTKSLSTSSFDDQGTISKNGNTASNSNLSSRGWRNNMYTNGSVSASVSNTQRNPIKANNNGVSNAWPNGNGNEGNPGICNVDRSGPREGDSVKLKRSNGSVLIEGRTEVAPASQSTQICTPEEIERKRLEAKMKLEAKRKLLGRSTSASVLSGGTAKRPVKR